MPTLTAIALDRFLEPGASKSPSSPATATAEKKKKELSISDDRNSSTKRLDIPPPHPQLRRRNTVAFTAAHKQTPARTHISPALYATPESTPLPDSPTSFPPSSPYIINHKRRGPRLSKSLSDQNVAAIVAEMKKENVEEVAKVHLRSFSEENVVLEQKEEKLANRHCLRDSEVEVNVSNGDVVDQEVEMNVSNGDLKVSIGSSLDKDGGETEDFFDPQESMSFTSTDGEDYSAGRSAKENTSMGEFFDAWEELSSESGRQSQRSFRDYDTELREMRLSLLMEIEKRKQSEEALNSMQSQWQTLREKLRAVGLILPEKLPASLEDSQPDVDFTEQICRQIHLARFVSESIGKGIAKAEVEAEMEAQLEMKNFEIARLCDRLHYYEAMNREMSQRNQEAIEIARLERQKRRRRQKWVWGSITAAITLGSAALAWSYLPSGKSSSSNNFLEASGPDSDVQ